MQDDINEVEGSFLQYLPFAPCRLCTQLGRCEGPCKVMQKWLAKMIFEEEED